MSSRHLGSGSEKPPLVDGKVRLYSMKFCPFAHRIRLILSMKNIPHDIVNVNLKNKPEWIFEVHPEGKVPAIVDVDGNSVADSTVIANYLDEKYPEPPLYNEETKARDLELLEQYDKVIEIFYNCMFKKDTRPLMEPVGEILGHLNDFETELAARESQFFGGDNPGMLDVMIWPWAERAKALPLKYDEPLEFDKEEYPALMQWMAAMRNLEFVQKNAGSYESYAKVIDATMNNAVDYDEI